MRKSFQNFQVDHMTLLLHPDLYGVAYLAFKVIFGVGPDDLLYEKRRDTKTGQVSMTYAVRIGQGGDKNESNTIIAVVQPSEPADQPSHVREMLDGHNAAAHWQHIALRTNDLLAFYDHARARGVRFITPILRDEEENLIQVFSGEWYIPGIKPSGMFFEFLQRQPSADSLKQVQESNNQTWFRDKTFSGLYDEKEREYQSGKVTPFLDFELFNLLKKQIGSKQVWEFTADDIKRAEETMLGYQVPNSDAAPRG